MNDEMRGQTDSVKHLLSSTWYWYDATTSQEAHGATHPRAAQVAGELIDKAIQVLREYQEQVSTLRGGIPVTRHDPEEARSVRHAAAALLHSAAAVLERT